MKSGLLGVMIWLWVCGGSPLGAEGELSSAPADEPWLPLSHTESSPEALARRFLQSLEEGNGEEIEKLALSKREFVKVVWPVMPAARPGSNFTSDWVWDYTYVRSRASLQSILRSHGGKGYQLEEVRFAGQSSQYPLFRVFRDTRLQVRDEQGRERELNLFGSVIEMKGRYKIVSFIR